MSAVMQFLEATLQDARGRMLALVLSPAVLGTAQAARAQAPPAGGDTRAARLAAQKAEKATQVTVYEPNKAEIWATC